MVHSQFDFGIDSEKLFLKFIFIKIKKPHQIIINPTNRVRMLN